jgi:hypothetical protein
VRPPYFRPPCPTLMQWATIVYTSMVPSDVKAQDLGNVVVLTGVAAIQRGLAKA